MKRQSRVGSENCWVGADPGGLNRFGIALLLPRSRVRSAVVSCADEAVEYVARNCEGLPKGVGIDAPLWWSSGQKSMRAADYWIRKEFGISSGTVQAGNSLRGAALIQGAMLAVRVRERFPNIQVTETHPKALLLAIKTSYAELCRRRGLISAAIKGIGADDRQDAVLSAIWARDVFEGRWTRDLTKERGASEQDPSSFWLKPIYYYWPER
jgi:predicted nuclease with RNAse H fold